MWWILYSNILILHETKFTEVILKRKEIFIFVIPKSSYTITQQISSKASGTWKSSEFFLMEREKLQTKSRYNILGPLVSSALFIYISVNPDFISNPRQHWLISLWRFAQPSWPGSTDVTFSLCVFMHPRSACCLLSKSPLMWN